MTQQNVCLACCTFWHHVIYCSAFACGCDGALFSTFTSAGCAVKTAQWSKLYYGQLPYGIVYAYLLTFAAAKTHIQFYIIERGNVAQPKAVGPKILLETMSGRAKALLAAVNLHRILRTVENYLPQEVLPVDKLQVSCNPQGYIREL